MFPDLEPEVSSERDVIWVVHALYDSGYWSFDQVSDWAVDMISRIDEPAWWFFNLIFPARAAGEEPSFFTLYWEARSDNSNFDKAIFDDLLLGFVLMGAKRNKFSWQTTLDRLVDTIDGSFATQFQPEDFAYLKEPTAQLIALQHFCEKLPAQIVPENLLAAHPEMFKA